MDKLRFLRLRRLLSLNPSVSTKSYPSFRSQSTTNFGYERIPEEEKVEKVKNVFANVAEKYDLMNDAMSLGIHRLWKDYFVNNLRLRPSTKLLDVAGGTGDIAFRALRQIQIRQADGHVTIADINQRMLDVGIQRADEDSMLDKSKITWVCANAEQLPFEDNSFDTYTIAFGIRNCTHIDKVLKEAYRVLKPNGRFACLEFSQIAPTLKPFYDLYSFQVIPIMGQILASDYNSYKYLVESIRVFPDQMNSSGGCRVIQHGRRAFTTSKTNFLRFRSAMPPDLIKVGQLLKESTEYKPGQNFDPNMTAYLTVDEKGQRERSLSWIRGMECVMHEDILPFTSDDVKPIDHDLFDRLFEKIKEKESSSTVDFKLKQDLSGQRGLSPHVMYRVNQNGVQLTMLIFYLGSTIIRGELKHVWRYTIRLKNGTKKTVILRHRDIKLYHLSKLEFVSGRGAEGQCPTLTPQIPVYQYTSVLYTGQPKGTHFWGSMRMESEDGTSFEVSLPSVPLEVPSDSLNEQENIIL